jgi:hypothetical protein
MISWQFKERLVIDQNKPTSSLFTITLHLIYSYRTKSYGTTGLKFTHSEQRVMVLQDSNLLIQNRVLVLQDSNLLIQNKELWYYRTQIYSYRTKSYGITGLKFTHPEQSFCITGLKFTHPEQRVMVLQDSNLRVQNKE